MYSSEDLERQCKPNTIKLVLNVEVQPVLSKGFTFSTRQRHCLMVCQSRISVSGTMSLITYSTDGTRCVY